MRLEALLTGAWEYRIDRKGRVVIPAEACRLLGSPMILLPLVEVVERQPRWTIGALSQARFQREVTANSAVFGWWLTRGSMAWVTEVDRAARRALIPATLRELCGIRPGELVIVRGMGTTLQILPQAVWQAQVAEQAMLGRALR